jgi:hypothetical protein
VDGIRICVDPCRQFTCGQSEACVVRSKKAQCECLANFVRNPTSGRCEKPGRNQIYFELIQFYQLIKILN